MFSLFKKKMNPEELFEKAMKYPEEIRISLLQTVMMSCKRRDRYVAEKIINEVLKLSKNPIKDLRRLLEYIKDDELAVDIVDRIAGYGMEEEEVNYAIRMICQGLGETSKAAINRAEQHYERYYEEVTFGRKKYFCTNEKCGYVYDREVGDPIRGIHPGTSFLALPDNWRCPHCSWPKSSFDFMN